MESQQRLKKLLPNSVEHPAKYIPCISVTLAIVFTFITSLITLTGCASTPDPTKMDLSTAEQAASKHQASSDLKPYYQRIYMEGESNSTLNRMRLASAAMEYHQWNDAEQALDEVINEIETVGKADERSQKALSKFDSEEIKRFKGEAYERSMAYFLRGLLFLRVQQWENARACFKSVQFQDAAKQDPKMRQNWASADWLEGWCSWQLGENSNAQDAWKRSNNHHIKIQIPPPEKNTDVLCVALLGFGPVKNPQGKYGELLGYSPAISDTFKVAAFHHPSTQPQTDFVKCEDLYEQAASRGKRYMDTVNEDKADVRQSTEIAGDVLTTGGMGAAIGGAVSGDDQATIAGLGAMTAGVATKGIASAINPKADTRTWDLLPASIHLASFSAPTKAENIQFRFFDNKSRLLRTEEIEIQKQKMPQIILLIER